MSRQISVIALGVGLAIAFVSCATRPNPSAAPPPIPPGGGAPFVTDDEAAAARTLFVAKCTQCHKYHDPAKYNTREWNDWFTKMSKKAKLKSDQKELLSRYLEVFRAPAETNSAGNGKVGWSTAR
jgi:hypothetical protein